MNLENDPYSELPERLVADLRVSQRREVPIPAGFDEDLLAAAHQRLAARRRWRWVVPVGGLIGSGAAAAVLLLVLHWAGSGPATVDQFALGAAPVKTATPDILTAYRLAYALKQGVHPSADWDRNGDGKVDQQDVDAWAAAAVALPASEVGGGGQ